MVEGQAEPKEVSHVEEAEEISRLVLQAGNLDGAEAQTIYQRFRQIVSSSFNLQICKPGRLTLV